MPQSPAAACTVAAIAAANDSVSGSNTITVRRRQWALIAKYCQWALQKLPVKLITDISASATLFCKKQCDKNVAYVFIDTLCRFSAFLSRSRGVFAKRKASVANGSPWLQMSRN